MYRGTCSPFPPRTFAVYLRKLTVCHEDSFSVTGTNVGHRCKLHPDSSRLRTSRPCILSPASSGLLCRRSSLAQVTELGDTKGPEKRWYRTGYKRTDYVFNYDFYPGRCRSWVPRVWSSFLGPLPHTPLTPHVEGSSPESEGLRSPSPLGVPGEVETQKRSKNI